MQQQEHHTPPPPLRYPIANKFPVATLAPYVGTSAAAVKWCAANRVDTIGELRRAMRPYGKFKRIKCPAGLHAEFERLLDPPGIPAAWPPHPNEDHRVEQHLVHAAGLYGVLRRAIFDAKNRWEGMLYLIHFEDDFLQYKGIGPGLLPAVLAWREYLRGRFPRPVAVLTPEVLKGREFGPVRQNGSPASAGPSTYMPPSTRTTSTVKLIVEFDLADPHLVEKVRAIRSIVG